MAPKRFDPLIAAYIRRRVTSECRSERGRATDIATKTGFSHAHISNIMDGSRNVGDSFAQAIAAYWKMSIAQMSRAAHAERAKAAQLPHGSPASTEVGEGRHGGAPGDGDTHPNLTATLVWCRGTNFPDAYLDEYGQEARRWSPDRPKQAWLADIEAKYWEWKDRHGYPSAEPLPPMEGWTSHDTAEPPIKPEAERSGARGTGYRKGKQAEPSKETPQQRRPKAR